MGNKRFSSLKTCLPAKLIFNAKQSVSRALLVMTEKSDLWCIYRVVWRSVVLKDKYYGK